MKKKILTIEDLVQFCQKTGLANFNAADTGYQLCVQVPATYQKSEHNFSDDGTMLFCKIKLYHIGINRNNSSVTEEAAKNSLKGIKYKPILCNFCEIDGVRDFTSHDMKIREDGTIEYIEAQIGSLTADEPYLEYDKEQDKTYVYAWGAIPRAYTDAADIIERKNGTKCSVELLINAMQWNANDNVLELTDITVQGVTLLGKDPETGKDVGEGMIGARVDIQDFSQQNNSLFSNIDVSTKMLETLDRLQETLSNFNIGKIPETEKGGKTNVKLQELLEKYSLTESDITFSIDGLTDEELEAKFKEVYEKDSADAENNSVKTDDGNTADGTAQVDHQNDATSVPATNSHKKKYSVEVNGEIKEFELSLNDIQDALWNLVNDTYSEADNTYYSVTAYENYLVMHDWWTGRNYKQCYRNEDGNFMLTGDRVAVYANWLTKDEEAALDEMRTNYAAIKEELTEYKSNEELMKKQAILADEAYADFCETEEFKTLSENIEQYSENELRDKCEIAFAKLVRAQGTFSAKKTVAGSANAIPVIFSEPEKEKKPYGDLFD